MPTTISVLFCSYSSSARIGGDAPGTFIMRLMGKRAVITGGGSGIGAATASLFAAEGACVAILDSDLPRAERIATQICESGGDAVAWACDVTNEIQLRDTVDRAAQHLGAIDILFNSAGIAIRRAVSDTEVDDWDRIMDTNLRGSFLSSKFCLEHFRQEGGSIIHVSSVTGIIGVRSRAAYSASKGGSGSTHAKYGRRFSRAQHPRQLCVSGLRPHTAGSNAAGRCRPSRPFD